MDDAYRALARAIRQPMRRWWLRVGVWWLGLLFIFYLFEALYFYYLHSYIAPGRWLDYPLMQLEFLLRLLYPAIILLVSGRVLAACRTTLKGFPHPYSRTLNRSLFIVVLIHCLPVLVAFFVYELVVFLIHLSTTELTGLDFCMVLYGFGHRVYLPGSLVLPFVLWLIVLQIVLPRSPWLAWLWYIVAYLLLWLRSPLDYLDRLITGSRSIYHVVDGTWVPSLHSNCGWLVGMLLVVLMMRSFQSSSKWPGYSIAGVLIAGGFLNNYSHRIPLVDVNVLDHPCLVTAIDFWRSWHAFLTDSIVFYFKETYDHTLPYYQLTGVGELTSNIPFTWSASVTGWVVCFVPFAHILYIAGVIAFIYYVILAPLRRRAKAAHKTAE